MRLYPLRPDRFQSSPILYFVKRGDRTFRTIALSCTFYSVLGTRALSLSQFNLGETYAPTTPPRCRGQPSCHARLRQHRLGQDESVCHPVARHVSRRQGRNQLPRLHRHLHERWPAQREVDATTADEELRRQVGRHEDQRQDRRTKLPSVHFGLPEWTADADVTWVH